MLRPAKKLGRQAALQMLTKNNISPFLHGTFLTLCNYNQLNIYFKRYILINKIKKMRHFKLLLAVLFLYMLLTFNSCGDKTDEELKTQEETSSDKDKELKDREEFLRLKEEELRAREEALNLKDSLGVDTTKEQKDSAKVKEEEKKKEKNVTEKEKELNKRLDNPKTAVTDYLEYIKRGVNESGSFDKNMKNASELWLSPSFQRFKSNYKNTTKFIVLSEPKVVSQKGDNAKVKVKVKKVDAVTKDGSQKETSSEMTVTYNLVADKNGKWKIKNNVVVKDK